jgi:hypothetical protein
MSRQIDIRWNWNWNEIVQACYIQYSTDDDTFDVRKLYSTRIMTPTCHGKEKAHKEE